MGNVNAKVGGGRGRGGRSGDFAGLGRDFRGPETRLSRRIRRRIAVGKEGDILELHSMIDI